MSTNRLPPALALPRTSKRILLEWHERALDVLARWRASRRESRLPDFLIIGAQKCVTTYLYRTLVEHPLVLPALRKEVHFFDNGYRRGLAWYRGYFPVRAGADISGEASPYYFFHPHAPRRIKECVPGVKLILLLRHPVMRAYSHF